MPHRYLIGQTQILDLPPKPWKEMGVEIIVGLPYDTAQALYTRALGTAEAQEIVTNIRHRLPNTDLWLGLLASNEQGLHRPGGAILMPWADNTGWSRFLGNVERLATAAAAWGFRGIDLDCECYIDGHLNNGGPMKYPYAWPAGNNIYACAREFRKACGKLELMLHVWAKDALNFPSFVTFARSANPEVFCDEGGYLSRDYDARYWRSQVQEHLMSKVAVMPGINLTRQVARSLKTLPPSFLWTKNKQVMGIWS